MMAPSVVTIGSALAGVLGLVVMLAHFLKQARRGRAGEAAGPPVRVLARAGLAPRQGVATLQVGDRLILVAYGEGGVRYLTDLDDDEVDGVRGTTAREVSEVSKISASRLLGLGGLDRGGPGGWMIVAILAGTLAFSAPLAAQTASPGGSAAVDTLSAQLGSGPPIQLTLGGDEDDEPLRVSGPVGAVLFIGAMTLIPTLLLLTTSFTRILIVLHLLKQALGTQTAPPAHLLAALSLLLTGFVMAPTFEVVNEQAIVPWMNGEVDELEMFRAGAVPVRDFMLGVTRDQDLQAFLEMSDAPPPETVDDVPFVVITSAFVTSELTSAFQMGFALFLPFVIIDVVVASVLMSMGMFMLPPVMVSLPFKLLLFVLVDGWSLILGGLVQSF